MASSEEGPARLLTPPPPSAVNTLPYKINAETKQLHTELNKLITSRLSLALPPQANNPIPYLHGIDTFSQLYLTFEEAWQDLIESHLTASKNFSSQSPDPSDPLRSYLATLVPPALWRTHRLEADLAHLKPLSPETLPVLDNNAVVNKITTRMEEEFEAKPHVLLAYAWVLYMAIFSGGRWMRSQLVSAGPEFWGREEGAPPAPPKKGQGDAKGRVDPGRADTKGLEVAGQGRGEEQGISLFYFDGASDGEDIKAEFKTRFAKADEILSDEQKADVVKEAQSIFQNCIEMVEDLDARLGTPAGMVSPQAEKRGEKPTRELKGQEGAQRNVERDDVTVTGLMKELLPKEGEFAPNAGMYVTKGMSPWVAGVAIAVGIGAWWLAHRWGLLSNLRPS